jgi:hypothetical protein
VKSSQGLLKYVQSLSVPDIQISTGGGVGDQSKSFFALSESYFGPFSRRNIAGDFRKSHYSATRILDRADDERDVNSFPRFFHSGCFIVFNASSSSQLLQNLVLLIRQLGRDEDRNRLANGFRLCISKDALRARVPTGDDCI